jgi:hypothetical protein
MAGMVNCGALLSQNDVVLDEDLGFRLISFTQTPLRHVHEIAGVWPGAIPPLPSPFSVPLAASAIQLYRAGTCRRAAESAARGCARCARRSAA